MSRKFQDRQQITIRPGHHPTITDSNSVWHRPFGSGLRFMTARNRRASICVPTETGEDMARWAKGEQTIQFLVGRNRLESFEADDLATLTGALIGRATPTDDVFCTHLLGRSRRPTHGPQMPLTLRIRRSVNPHREGRNPAGEASSPTTPLRKVHACGMRTRPPQARSGLSGQPGTYATKISVPPSDSGIRQLHARMKEPKPEPEARL
jgi:hypothetical protein